MDEIIKSWCPFPVVILDKKIFEPNDEIIILYTFHLT